MEKDPIKSCVLLMAYLVRFAYDKMLAWSSSVFDHCSLPYAGVVRRNFRAYAVVFLFFRASCAVLLLRRLGFPSIAPVVGSCHVYWAAGVDGDPLLLVFLVK